MSRSRLLKGGAWLTAGNAVSSGASFLRNIVIARFVSVEDFGIVVLLSLTLSVIEMVSNLAIDRLLVQSPDGDAPMLQSVAHALQVIRGLAGGVVMFFMADALASLFKIPRATWAFQVLALVPVIRSFVHLDTIRYQRDLRYAPTFWVDSFPQGVSLLCAALLAYLLRDYSAIVWATLAMVLAQVATTHYLATRPYRWSWDGACIRRVIAFGWPLLANGLLMFAILQGDKAILAVAFTPEIVGWYGAAFMLSMAPAMLATSVIQGLFLPVLARHQAQPDEFLSRYAFVVQFSLGIALATGAFFAVFGPELLMTLFGRAYAPGTEVVILLGVTQGVRIAKAGVFVTSIAKARTADPLLANLARGVSLVLSVWLVSSGFGPVEVACAGLIGEFASLVIALRLLAPSVSGSERSVYPMIGVCAVLTWSSYVVGGWLRTEHSTMGQLMFGAFWILATLLFLLVLSPEWRASTAKLVARRRHDA